MLLLNNLKLSTFLLIEEFLYILKLKNTNLLLYFLVILNLNFSPKKMRALFLKKQYLKNFSSFFTTFLLFRNIKVVLYYFLKVQDFFFELQFIIKQYYLKKIKATITIMINKKNIKIELLLKFFHFSLLIINSNLKLTQ